MIGEITSALLAHKDKLAREILGGIDAMKVKSCMTLFDCISPNDIFAEVLSQFYDGTRDNNSYLPHQSRTALHTYFSK